MKKTSGRWTALLMALTLCAGLLAGCGKTAERQNGPTRQFTDSAGRQVEVPETVDAIAPSGSYAQMILYTLCPDKLMGLSSALTRKQKEYISEKYWDLPVFGQFYGSGSTVSYEAICAAAPDIIIDMGEAKDGIADDMDAIQEATGIPTVFIQADLDGMADAYETLGELTGETERAGQLASYISGVLDDAAEKAASIPDAQKKRVLYCQGEYGTEVNGAGGLHAEVLERAGAKNVAVLDDLSPSGGDEVPMEKILLWDPEVVVLAPDSYYDGIFDDPAWSNVTAVKTGQVYETPIGPYNWLDRPPSVQRILGIQWLGNLLYPEVFTGDIAETARNFYQKFFHIDLTDAQLGQLLQNARPGE